MQGENDACNAANAYSGDYLLARFLYVYLSKNRNQPTDPLCGEFLKYVLSGADTRRSGGPVGAIWITRWSSAGLRGQRWCGECRGGSGRDAAHARHQRCPLVRPVPSSVPAAGRGTDPPAQVATR